MKIIAGLGNPGEKYSNTLHNAGFSVIDEIAQNFNCEFEENKKFSAKISKCLVNNSEALLVKPQTFMNKSGESVSKILNFYSESMENLIVIHDDVDLELGQNKFVKNAGAAGHHGIENIIDQLGSKDFWRLRIGVGRPQNNKFDVKDFVLSRQNKIDAKAAAELLVSKL